MSTGQTVGSLASTAAALGGYGGGFWALRRRRLIQDTPTTKTAAVAAGLNELKGAARCAGPLRSPLAGSVCVYFSASIEEEWRRTETYEENGQTKTRTTTGWDTMWSSSEHVRFELEDDTGRVWVDPDGASMMVEGVLSETGGPEHRLYGLGGGRHPAGSTGRRRFSESALPVDAAVYLLGPARLPDGRSRPEIGGAADGDKDTYLISTKSEEQLVKGYGWKTGAAFTGSIAGAAAAPAFLDAATLAPVTAGAAGVATFGAYGFSTWNTLVAARNAVDRAWANVEVELQRRADLLPNLAEVVRAYAAHEAGTLEAVTALRSTGGKHDDGDVRAGNTVDGAQVGRLRQLFALAERYPNLQADARFRDLSVELVRTEDRLALARTFFNDSVLALRNRVEQFPGALLARFGRFPRGELFAADGLERTVPSVA